MTDDERRQDIDRSLQQWVRAQIAKGHPAGLVKERIMHVRGLGFRAEQSTSERIMSAIHEATQAGWPQPVGSEPRMPQRPSAGRISSGKGE